MYRNAGFSLKFINETICNFERGKKEILYQDSYLMKEKRFQ